jgi:predicted enzyme related to lactoylglutathione lyase
MTGTAWNWRTIAGSRSAPDLRHGADHSRSEEDQSFRTQAAFEAWLAANHARATEVWLRACNDSIGSILNAIGLFQGMFEKNILTFNPGWDSNAQKLAAFTDIRERQRRLKAQGIQLQQEADESTTGPASFVAVDPDGNPILVDQHV